MKISTHVKEAIIGADAKALATTGPHGVNVVPVSAVEVFDDVVHLFNFFMDKTVQNIQAEPQVALTVWKGLSGIQMKAIATYVTEGVVFDAAVTAMRVMFPSRILAGVVILTPVAIFDISIGESSGKKQSNISGVC